MTGVQPSVQPIGDRWCPQHGFGPCLCQQIAPSPPPVPLIMPMAPVFTPYPDPSIVKRLDELEKDNAELRQRLSRLERQRKRKR